VVRRLICVARHRRPGAGLATVSGKVAGLLIADGDGPVILVRAGPLWQICWRVVSVPDGMPLAVRDLPRGVFLRRQLQLGADGPHALSTALGLKGERGVIPARATVAEFACGTGRAPALHPAWTHLLLCDGKARRIRPMAGLTG
jgi:hypothetical protein